MGVNDDLDLTVGSSNSLDEKIGLDVKNGRYKITGVVFTGKVFKRPPNKSGKKTNIVPKPIGYRVEDVNTGDKRLVTKDEALYLVIEYKSINAFVMESNKSKYDSEGNMIKKDFRHHLQPFPSTTEAFTRDDRLINVYKFDAEGEIILIPEIELNISEEECTKNLWELVKEDLKSKEKVRKKLMSKSATVNKKGSKERLHKAFNKLKTKIDFDDLGI